MYETMEVAVCLPFKSASIWCEKDELGFNSHVEEEAGSLVKNPERSMTCPLWHHNGLIFHYWPLEKLLKVCCCFFFKSLMDQIFLFPGSAANTLSVPTIQHMDIQSVEGRIGLPAEKGDLGRQDWGGGVKEGCRQEKTAYFYQLKPIKTTSRKQSLFLLASYQARCLNTTPEWAPIL